MGNFEREAEERLIRLENWVRHISPNRLPPCVCHYIDDAKACPQCWDAGASETPEDRRKEVIEAMRELSLQTIVRMWFEANKMPDKLPF